MNKAAGAEADSETGLVLRAQRGDSAALSALVSRYQDRVYNTCYRMCNNEADALDLTQTTFVRALSAIGRFEARSGFYTWLFRIAVNLTMSHRRQKLRRSAAALDSTVGDGWSFEPAADDAYADVVAAAERDEMRERLCEALLRLDEEFRAAVVLKDIEEMDYATIAEILEVPIGTVKSRIHRGRTMLRKMLTKAGA